MKTFYFTVRGDRITEKEDYIFTEGNKGSYEAVFDFGAEWDDMAKLCVVENGEDVYKIAIIGNSCLLPEMMKSSAKIGVIGVDSLDGAELVTRISTNMIGISVQNGAASKETTASLDSAAQVWEKYLSDMETSRKAAEAAQEAAVGAKEASVSYAHQANDYSERALSAMQEANRYMSYANQDAQAAAKSKEESAQNASTAVSAAGEAESSAQKAKSHAETAESHAANVKLDAQKVEQAEERIGNIVTESENRLTELKKSVQMALDEVLYSESNAKASEEAAEKSKTDVAGLTSRAETAAENAEESEKNASVSEKTASQALSDLLAMINSGDLVLATDGKLPLSSIPATATQEIYTVSSENELTGLTAQRGDLAELIEEINGEQTITKTWQCLGDASVRENWVVWGTSYAVQSGNATTADNATNANMINNHRIVEMTEEDFASAVKDEDTYYLVY